MIPAPYGYWQPIYDFCKDQGSLIAGFLALVAAVIAVAVTWKVGRTQVNAIQQQSELLKKQNADIILWNQLVWADQERQRDHETLQGISICMAALNQVSWQINRVADILNSDLRFSNEKLNNEGVRLIKEWITPPEGIEITSRLTRMAQSTIGLYDLLIVSINDLRLQSSNFPIANILSQIGNIRQIVESLRHALEASANLTQNNIQRYNHIRPKMPANGGSTANSEIR